MRRLLLISLVAMSPAAWSAEPEQPLGIAISGGVSLGTWESGFMYLYLEGLKARPGTELRIITGASAGSANAFVSAVSSCLPHNPHPLEDPGWDVWGHVGFADLFDRHRATSEALFVKSPLEAAIERVRLIWNRGLPEQCDVVFGASVTRVQPRQVPIKEGLTVSRAQETFVVRIQGRGLGKPPRLSNYVDPLATSPVPLLSFIDDESPKATEHNYTQLRNLVLASGAFPLAFRSQTIEYCLSKVAHGGKPADVSCVVPDFSELFVDGGMFDNNPLRLAWNVADRRLLRRPDGHFVWADAQTPTEATLHPASRYLYLDPDTEVYPVEPVTRPVLPERGFLARLLSLGGDMVDSARARELGQLVNERGDVPERLHLAMSNLPKASEYLEAFIGFFDKDFRFFDFYLGMYDALVELRTTPAWQTKPVDYDGLLAHDEQARREWAPFMCLLSVTEPGFERYLKHCDGPELANFRVLLQVSLDRLYERCRPSETDPKPSPSLPHFHCERATRGLEGPHVPGVEVLPEADRRRRKHEDGFDHFMRLLGAYHFEFKDLGLTRAQAGEGKLALRQQLDEVVNAWAGAHDSYPQQIIAMSAGRIALHEIEFSPPLYSGYVAAGSTVEAGVSVVPFFWKPRWLQLTGALGVGQLETLATERRPRVSMALTAGPEFHLTPLSSAALQPRLAARAGVQFGVSDGFGTSTCQAADPRDCTQGVVELAAIVTLFERVRVHLIWQTYPRLYGQTQGFFHLQFGIGFQFM